MQTPTLTNALRNIAAVSCALSFVAAAIVACGESRRPIGDECLRSEDCLSGVCAARSCVAAPALVTGASNPPPDEEPLIPSDDGGTSAIKDADATATTPTDAKAGG